MHETTSEEYRDRRKLLADALRTGDWRRGKYSLKTAGNCYCIMGMICEVYRRLTGIGEWLSAYDGTLYKFSVPSATDDGVEESTLELPEPVRGYFGFTTAAGYYVAETGEIRSFLTDNDQDRITSPVVFAGMIDNPPKDLFRPETL